MNPNLQGHLLLARGFAEAVSRGTGDVVRRDLSEEEACRRLPCDRTARLTWHLQPAQWLLAVSAGHPDPRDRLALVQWHFRQMVAMDPDSVAAWLGLAMVDVAGKGHLLWDPVGRSVMIQMGMTFLGASGAAGEQAQQALEYLSQSGLDPSIEARLRQLLSESDGAIIPREASSNSAGRTR